MCDGVSKSGSPRISDTTVRPCAWTWRISARMLLTAVGVSGIRALSLSQSERAGRRPWPQPVGGHASSWSADHAQLDRARLSFGQRDTLSQWRERLELLRTLPVTDCVAVLFSHGNHVVLPWRERVEVECAIRTRRRRPDVTRSAAPQRPIGWKDHDAEIFIRAIGHASR